MLARSINIKKVFWIAMTSILILCSCNMDDDFVANSDISSLSTENTVSSVESNVSIDDTTHSYEDYSNKEDDVITTPTLREQFKYKYGYDIDIFDYMPDDKLYTLLLNNPIDQWASDAGHSAVTTDEMLEIENILHQNWSREIDVSLGNLVGILSADTYNALCVNVQHKIELASETRKLSQNILRDLELDGTYSTVLTKIQLNKAYKKIVFELKYLEYIAYTHYDISDKQVSIQFIEP